MKKSILTIGAIAVTGILLASCNGAKDYSVKREDVNELSSEEANALIASRSNKYDELYETYTNNGYVSLKDTINYETEDYKYESSVIYDIATCSFYIDYSKTDTKDNYKCSYTLFAYLNNDKYAYGFDMSVENYPIYKYVPQFVPGVGKQQIKVVDHTKTGSAKVKGEMTAYPLTNDSYATGMVCTVSLTATMVHDSLAKFYATEDKSYYWSELNKEDENYHEICVSENNLFRYQMIETKDYKGVRTVEYFEKNQLDDKNKDFTNYKDGSIPAQSVLDAFFAFMPLDDFVDTYVE